MVIVMMLQLSVMNIFLSSNGLPLEPNETYTVNRTVTLPSSVAVGSGYLLFKTDAYNYQTESNENDNVYTQAIDIARPNLIITNITAPTTATASQTITLSWTGKNDSSDDYSKFLLVLTV
ncbi:MAG UNVERIFIED_CONTAM: hypothetical protein LVR29_05945 [Microcystis novacekii LVE1205-3]|jgi:subtilase family serine protease